MSSSSDGKGNEAVIKKVANSLVEDKSAIQKSALIDVSSEFDWDVLADERKLKESGEITDYFRDFLGVQLKEVASVLTCRAVSVVGKWQRAVDSALIPNDEERGNYKARAVSYMSTSEMFDIDAFTKAVVKDEDPKRRTIALANLKEVLSSEGISNQKFQPKPKSLPKTDKKQIWRTEEGLILEFVGEHQDFGIEVVNRPDGQKGKRITITTKGYEAK